MLDRRLLIPTGRETWAGVRVVIDAIMRSQRSVAPGVTLGLNARTNWSEEEEDAKPIFRFITSKPRSEIWHETTTIATSTTTAQTTSSGKKNAFRVEHYRRLEILRRKQEKARREFRRLKDQNCLDNSPWCAYWIMNNPEICRTSAIYMQQQCAQSCQQC